MTGLALFLTVFLACAVEAVEATTIVLAAATARNAKSAVQGTLAALGLLAIIILVFGPTLISLPINSLRLFVGTLLLLFGMQWMRKAILRSSGFKALHDEDAIYKDEIAQASQASRESKFAISDWYAFTLSFKGVLLEGLEVVFIVLTFGAIHHGVGLASVAALSAVVVVSAIGLAARKPLARAPENTMKFIVGIALTSFGIFWGAEGAGAKWPGNDAAIPVIALALVLLSFVLVKLLKLRRSRQSQIVTTVPDFDELDEVAVKSERGVLQSLTAFGYFWYDFIIGDDLVGALLIVIALEMTNALSHSQALVSWSWLATALGVVIALALNLSRVTSAKKSKI
jgi:uncharacterized membrane protein